MFISSLRTDNRKESNDTSGVSIFIYNGFIQDKFTDTREVDPDLNCWKKETITAPCSQQKDRKGAVT